MENMNTGELGLTPEDVKIRKEMESRVAESEGENAYEGGIVIPLNNEATTAELNEELESLHIAIDDEDLSEEALLDAQEKINAIQLTLADRESKTAA
jgi:hypothetical protein